MKQVLITGASSGIGRALAMRLEGQAKLVLMARNQFRLDKLADECGAIAVAGDVGDFTACQEFASRIGPGPISLVNCAGLAQFGDTAAMPIATTEGLIRANLLGTIFATQAVLPRMLENGQGHIINIASIAAIHAFSGAAAYSAAKAGVLAFSKVVNAEYRTRGIHCTAVILGAVDTPIWDGADLVPNRADMLQPETVAETLEMLINQTGAATDEIVLMPPKGIL